ncbi:MAG: ABC transporter ATP-binding protein [Opitutaceae bacterium]|nr:ABC transporter ATP-binding protein [Opitutaceae bacterium]
MGSDDVSNPNGGAGNWSLIKRLLALSWNYRRACLKVLILQVILLSVGLAGLSLAGLGLDVIHHEMDPSYRSPNYPFGMEFPAEWKSMTKIGFIAGLVFILAAVRASLNYLYSISVASLVHQEVMVNLRSQVFEKLQQLSFRFFDSTASGSIINRVTGDVNGVQLFVNGVLIQSIIMLLSLGVYMMYMLHLSVSLTLACLVTIPVLWILSILFSRSIRPAHVKNRQLYDTLILRLSEGIKGVHAIKGFGREKEMREQFEATNNRYRRQQRKIFWRVSLYSPTVGFLTQISMTILLGYGGYLVFQGELAIGTGLVVFAGLLQQFSGQVSNFANIANSIQASLTGAKRVFEILDAPVEVESKVDAIRLSQSKGAIVFENIGFEYKQMQPTLKGITFSVEPGECVAIVGATGSGKSSLMSLIPRFYDVTSGKILFDGHDLREINLDDLRRNIGIVFQESFLFSNTVAANISFGYPDATREQVEAAAKVAAAHEFIMELPKGYETILEESGGNLSGGQRQRLAIARAILLEPSVLLLDDPTAAIDSETEREIFEAMDRAISGRTTFVVAHRLSTLKKADKIIVLDRGRVVQIGTHTDLIRQSGLYQRLAKLQIVDDLQEREKLLDEVRSETRK